MNALVPNWSATYWRYAMLVTALSMHNATGSPMRDLLQSESSLLLTVVTLGLVIWAVCMLCAVAS